MLAGVLFTFSLSPFDVWPLALVVPGLVYLLLRDASVGSTMLRLYLFNVGLFAAGASWIYVSIHVYGNASPLLAGFLVAAFVLSYSLVSLPQGWLYGRFFNQGLMAPVLAFTGLWVLQEWFRSWFLTGFPWLFQGYGLLESPLVNAAPMLGVFGLSLVGVLLSVSVAEAAISRRWQWLLVWLLVVPVLLIDKDRWTTPGPVISVSLIQGNIDQHVKWHRENRAPIFDVYRTASRSEWGRDLVIWPEASITYFREESDELLAHLEKQAGESSLLLGLPDRDEDGGFQNTVMMVGAGEGQYIKRRLVPFGEYVPLEAYLRGLIDFFDLPMSRNQSGPWQQDPLTAGDYTVSVSICYEVVYPELVRTTVKQPDLLVTVSNDTWFGKSIGPWQHLQMARMRALENGRSMARGTNNGVTALINHLGEVTHELPQFEAAVLRGDMEIRRGTTPYHRFGVYPVLLIAVLLVLGAAVAPRVLGRPL